MKHKESHILMHLRRIISLTFFVCFVDVKAVIALKAYDFGDLTTKIAHNYYKTFKPTQHTAANNDPLHIPPKGKVVNINDVNLSETTQRKVVLRTIFSNLDTEPTRGMHILNFHAWNDLKLFFGSKTNPQRHLLSLINKTTTVLGECALATLLVTPTSDIPTLTNRQKTIKFFIDNLTCYNDAKQILHNYRHIEPRLLTFWVSIDPLSSQAYKEYMAKRFISTEPSKNKVAKNLHYRIFLRNLRDIYGEIASIPIIGATWSCINFLGLNIFNFHKVPGKKFIGSAVSLKESFETVGLFIPGYSIKFSIDNYLKIKNAGGKPSALPFLGVFITNSLSAWRIYCGVKNYKEYSMVFQNLAARLKDVQIFLTTIQKLDKLIKSNPQLEEAYGSSIKAIRALIERRHESSEIGTMLQNLLTMSLDKWSYFYNKNSQLLATYYLFEEHKDCFKAAMYELGCLDSLIGIASLIKTCQENHPRHIYTLTKFLSRQEQSTPLVKFCAMWNPLLNVETVVNNELDMASNKVRNMVLCGPNAGGKSSFLTSSAISVLLSQTFGIAPASDATITPFNKISTFIERGDDFSKGSSLFMVEVDKMRKHVNRLEQAQSDEFIFAIFDEPFSGTNPVEGGASTYSILSYIAQYPNAMHIVASHYPILMRLEHNVKGRGIKNFKVFLKACPPDQTLYNTYKVVPGESNQTAALNILKQHGYNNALVKQAEHIIKQQENLNKTRGNNHKPS